MTEKEINDLELKLAAKIQSLNAAQTIIKEQYAKIQSMMCELADIEAHYSSVGMGLYPKEIYANSSAKTKRISDLEEALRKLHKHTLYQLSEEDDRITHAPHEWFDQIEALLK